MGEEIKKLETLTQVQDWVKEMLTEEDKFIYRGQGDSSWKLQSTFIREENWSEELISSDEIGFQLIKKFIEEKIKYSKNELGNINFSNLSLIGKMQHFGKATPLIDFTEDIFVALWFAISYLPKNTTAPNYSSIFYKK